MDATQKKLDELKALASEHFDDYLIVVCKDDKIWETYKRQTSAYGMAKRVFGDIKKIWKKMGQNAEDEVEREEN